LKLRKGKKKKMALKRSFEKKSGFKCFVIDGDGEKTLMNRKLEGFCNLLISNDVNIYEIFEYRPIGEIQVPKVLRKKVFVLKLRGLKISVVLGGVEVKV
jgi:hypothetical protein